MKKNARSLSAKLTALLTALSLAVQPAAAYSETDITAANDTPAAEAPERDADYSVSIDASHFPDEALRNYITQHHFDTNSDGELSEEERSAVTEIRVSGLSTDSGISYFTKLERLECTNGTLTSLNLYSLGSLKYLDCSYNQITTLWLNSSSPLEQLYCSNNKISYLGLGRYSWSTDTNDSLKKLDCSENEIRELCLRGMTALTDITVGGNNIEKLDLNGCTSLRNVDLLMSGNPLRFIDLGGCTGLERLSLSGDVLGTVNVKGCSSLSYISVSAPIERLDVSGCTELTTLECNGGKLKSLNVSGCTKLNSLQAGGNMLASLDLTDCTALGNFSIGQNNSLPIGDVSEFELSELPGFDPAKASAWTGAVYHADTNKIDSFTGDTITYMYDMGRSVGGQSSLAQFSLTVGGTSGTFVPVSNKYFPDDVFRKYISENIDLDHDGYLSNGETAAVKYMDSVYDDETETYCADLEGIQYFTELTELYFESGRVSYIDISRNTKLTYLDLSVVNVDSIDVGSCTALEELHLYSRALTALDVSNNTALTVLDVSGCSLTSLDISGNTALTQLNVSDCSLTSLDIRNNTGLTALDVRGNNLTSIDLSRNTKLKKLDVAYNRITSLDLAGLTELQYLDCRSNCLAFVDLSPTKIPSVVYEPGRNGAELSGNSLTIGNVSSFSLSGLTGFDPSKASNWTDCVYNSAANTISGFTGLIVSYDYNCGDKTGSDGKTETYTETFTLCRTTEGGVEISVRNFPDEDFRITVEKYDIDNNGYLCDAEIEEIKALTLGGIQSIAGIQYLTALEELTLNNTSIKNLSLKGCPQLKTLICASEDMLTSLDVSENTLLEKLDCSCNQLETLDVSKNTQLTELKCDSNLLTELNVSKNTELTKLDCSYNSIVALDLSKNTKLTDISTRNNEYELHAASLDMSLYPGFDPSKVVECYGVNYDPNTNSFENFCSGIFYRDGYYTSSNSQYTYDTGLSDANGEPVYLKVKITAYPVDVVTIDAEHFPNENFRKYVSEQYDTAKNNNVLDSLEIGRARSIEIGGDDITGIEYLTGLCSVEIYNRSIPTDLSHAKWLSYLIFTDNPGPFPEFYEGLTLRRIIANDNTSLAYIDLTKFKAYEGSEDSCEIKNNSYYIGNVTSFDLSKIPGFDPAKASNWRGATYDPSTGKIGNFNGTLGNRFTDSGDPLYSITYTYNCGNGVSAQFALVYGDSGEPVEDTGIEVNETTFPDAAFRAYVLENFDTDGSGTLSEAEINAVTNIDVSEKNITDLKGIGYFTELLYLNCSYNSLTSLDISKNTKLIRLQCHENSLTSLDVSNNTALESISCRKNSITSLDVSMLTALRSLECHYNALSSLDVSHNPELDNLHCDGNPDLAEVDVSRNPKLRVLYCDGEKLTSLDVSHNPLLQVLGCGEASLTELDVSSNTALVSLYCYMNELTALDVSSNTSLTALNCSYNQLTSLDVSRNTALTELACVGNRLTSLDLSANSALTKLECSENSYHIGTASKFDLTKLPGFDTDKASSWNNAIYDAQTKTIGSFESDRISYLYDCGNGFTADDLQQYGRFGSGSKDCQRRRAR